MQFGRLVGGALALLGILLIFLELAFFLNAGRPELRREHDRPDALERRSHHVPTLPGILGGALVIGGVAVFFLARIEDEPDPKTAVK
jgi:hypothetical protein